MASMLIEYSPETEASQENAFTFGETGWPGEARAGGVFSEADELELAASLLEVSQESELDRFLGNLIRRAGQAAGRFVSSPVGQALGGILKGAARQALPVAARALGGYIGGARGAHIGGQLAAAAGRYFGLELEGLSPEDQEFEAAKAFIRFAGEAVKNAAAAPPRAAPAAVAQAAAVQAAGRYAPGLLPNVPVPQSVSAISGFGFPRAGRWMRRGRNIIINV